MSLEKLKQRRFREFTAQGATIRIRNISERERDELVKGLDLSKDMTVLRQRLVSAVMVEVDGSPVTVTPDDVAEFDYGVVTRIAEEAQEHCGLGDDEQGNSQPDDATSSA